MAEFPFYEPEQIVRRNLARNPRFANLGNQIGPSGNISGVSASVSISNDWSTTGDTSLKITPEGSSNTACADIIKREDVATGADAGKTYTISADFHLDAVQTGTLWANARRIIVRVNGNPNFALSAQAPNAVGTTRLSVSFTLPSSLQYWYVIIANGSRYETAYWDSILIEEGNNIGAPYFDGSTEPVEGDERRYRYTGEVGNSTSEYYLPAKGISGVSGVFDVGAATESRLGIVSDIYSRSREKIKLELALPDRQLIAGERVELAAAAMTASDVTWYWRQITGPEVELNKKTNTADFIAPNVGEDTDVRIGVYAASVDGRNRSDWAYFDLTIQPALIRYRNAEEGGTYTPVITKYVGYDRGPREVWNDVIPPESFTAAPRHEPEIVDLGIVPDDVQFMTEPPARAARGGVYIDPVTGDIYRNFGEGYNETDDTLAAPRKNAFWVNPATGDIFEWIED